MSLYTLCLSLPSLSVLLFLPQITHSTIESETKQSPPTPPAGHINHAHRDSMQRWFSPLGTLHSKVPAIFPSPKAQERDLFILPTTSESLLNEWSSTLSTTESPFAPGSSKPLSSAESIIFLRLYQTMFIRQVTGHALWRCLGLKGGSGASALHLPRQNVRAMTKPQEKHTVLFSKGWTWASDEAPAAKSYVTSCPSSASSSQSQQRKACSRCCHLLCIHRCSVFEEQQMLCSP